MIVLRWVLGKEVVGMGGGLKLTLCTVTDLDFRRIESSPTVFTTCIPGSYPNLIFPAASLSSKWLLSKSISHKSIVYSFCLSHRAHMQLIIIPTDRRVPLYVKTKLSTYCNDRQTNYFS
jgi:hypothetical protein